MLFVPGCLVRRVGSLSQAVFFRSLLGYPALLVQFFHAPVDSLIFRVPVTLDSSDFKVSIVAG